MGVLDQLKFGIKRARSLGHTEVTTDLIRPLPPEKKSSIISALQMLGCTVKYKGPMSFNFPHHLIRFRKKS
jgi:hypothetical protein